MATVTKLADHLTDVKSKSEKHSGNVLTIQSFLHGIAAQRYFDLGNVRHELKAIEKKLNDEVKKAKSTADTYLGGTHQGALDLVTNLRTFSQDELNAIDRIKQGNRSKDDMVIELGRLRDKAGYNDAKVSKMTDSFNTFRGQCSNHQGEFATYASNITVIILGDDGELKKLNDDLDSINSKLTAHIVGAGASALAIVGGAALFVVGAVGTVFTGGASLLAVAGGIALIGAGLGGAIYSGLTISQLAKLRHEKLTQKTRLTNESHAANLCMQGAKQLEQLAQGAVTDAQNLANSWNIMRNLLQSLRDQVDASRKPVEDIIKYELADARSAAESVHKSTDTILCKLQNVEARQPRHDQNVHELVRHEVEAAGKVA